MTKILRDSWIPAFAGMTEGGVRCGPVIPANAGIHEPGSGCAGLGVVAPVSLEYGFGLLGA